MLRLSISDRFAPFNYNAYLPIVPLCAGGIVVGALAHKRALLKLALAGAIAMLGAISFLREQPRILRGPHSAASPYNITVMTWNVKSYSWGSDDVIDTIIAEDPDILCLVEGTFGGRRPDKLARALGPGFNWAVGRRLSVASRLPILESLQLVDRGDLKVLRVVIDGPAGPFAILAVDLSPPRRRQPGAYEELRTALELESLPALMTGDLNTPRGTWQLNRTTADWTDVFAAHGTDRYLATWPSIPVPLWQIDHAFARDLPIADAGIHTTSASDHCYLLVNLASSPAAD